MPEPSISPSIQQRYPRAARYPIEWMLANEMGPNVVWLAEELSQHLPLTPGMKVLDHGCGRAISSIFFAKEFGVQVWANDLWIKPGGRLGIVVPGLVRDFDKPPEHLTRKQASGAVFWADDCWSFHTADWWRRHWSHHSGMELEHCELVADGWRQWLEWEELRDGRGNTGFPSEAEALCADAGRNVGFVCAVACKASPNQFILAD